MQSANRNTFGPRPDDSEPDSPERRKGESAKAFQAFGYFRDLGPFRSLDKAWKIFCYERGKKLTARHPGHWGLWSQVHNWVERAETHDELIEDEKRNAADDRRQRLHEARVLFDEEQQGETQKIVRTLNGVVEKLAEASLLEVKKRKEESPGKWAETKLKALDPSGLAKVVGVRNETLKLGTEGGDVKDLPQAERKVERIFWMKAPPDKAAEIHLVDKGVVEDVVEVVDGVVKEVAIEEPVVDLRPRSKPGKDPFPWEDDDGELLSKK